MLNEAFIAVHSGEPLWPIGLFNFETSIVLLNIIGSLCSKKIRKK